MDLEEQGSTKFLKFSSSFLEPLFSTIEQYYILFRNMSNAYSGPPKKPLKISSNYALAVYFSLKIYALVEKVFLHISIKIYEKYLA